MAGQRLWGPGRSPPTRVLFPAASRSHDYFGHENWDHQLKLAVAWNRVDIARSEIFSDERQWKVGLGGSEGIESSILVGSPPGQPPRFPRWRRCSRRVVGAVGAA